MSSASASMNGLHLRNDDSGAAITLAILKFNASITPLGLVKYQGLGIYLSKLNCALLTAYVVAIVLCSVSFAVSNHQPFVALYPLWARILSDFGLLLGILATSLFLMMVDPPLGWLGFLILLIAFVIVVRKRGVQFYRLVREPVVGTVSRLVNGFMDWFGPGLGHVGLASLSP